MREEDVLSLSGQVLLPSAETLNSLLNYDRDTGKLYWKPRGLKNWDSKYAYKEAGSLRPSGYVVVKLRDSTYKAHRIIWKMVYGEEPDKVDHIDGNKSNNSIINIRSVTHAENMKNLKMARNNTSGHSGIYWRKDSNKWKAVIGILGRAKSLGSFKTLEEALEARKLAEIEYGYYPTHGKIRA